MRRISTLLTLSSALVAILTITTVLAQQQQPNTFDIVPGTLVYFGSGTSKTGDPGTFLENERTSLLKEGSLLSDENGRSNNHDHARHYNKGNLRREHFRKRQFDNSKNARRQGQQCPGVCRYIPDRDFCPTDVVPEPAGEYEAYDDEDYEEDYSEEEEEDSEEYYYDEEYEDEEDETEEDEYNEVDRRKTKGRRGTGRKRLEPRKRLLTEPRLNEANKTSQMRGRNRADKLVHVVYPPITRFAASRGGSVRGQVGKESDTNENAKKNKRNGKSTKRRRRRQKKPVVQSPIKMRPSALEQEILIRWDHVFERGPFIGGDIVLPEGVLLRPPNFRFLRKQWPDAEIPFKMDPSLNSCRQNAILDAMDEIEDKTCIRFVERETERNYIDIRRATIGCSSYVGMVGGAQHLNLSTGCFSKFTVTHELMHAIGFDHEQSRKDRDKFIDIDFDNVLSEKEGQFELNPTFTGAGFPYDVRSIMHYSAFLFAKDKCEPTIYPANEKIDICELGMGNGKGGMTDCDAAKVNKMYKCSGKKYPKTCKVKK